MVESVVIFISSLPSVLDVFDEGAASVVAVVVGHWTVNRDRTWVQSPLGSM